MLVFTLIVLLTSYQQITSQLWNTSDGILPWESYLQLGDIQRPLGLTLNRSSLAHHHFAIGYLCLHSFMYDEAKEAFNLAINSTPTFIEAHIGKMLGCKHALWSQTDFDCGLSAYNDISTMLTTYNVTLSPFQSSLLSTVYQWYANRSSITAGEQAFLSSITNLSQTYQAETDIQVLRGLSLLNVAYESDFQGQMEPEQMIKAREVLQTALLNEPNHPGALHYLIIAYDVAQINISAMAIKYVLTYKNLVSTSSHAQHIPAQIWMRTGSILLAKSADETAVQVSLSLCLTKLLGNITSVSSSQLEPALAQLNTTDQVSSFLLCDAENRAISKEWISFSCLQTGDWLGTISPINDLFISYNRSIPASNHYLSFAYRTRARAIINLFYWLPYDAQFTGKTQAVQKLDEKISFVSLGDDINDWSLAWSEAGYRLSECLQLLTVSNTSYHDPLVKPIVDDHLARFAVLSARTASLNKYISTSISMMISQIRGIIYFKNDSFQECLSILNEAVQRESGLVIDNNSPTLIFARSSELLAMHLLLIHRNYIDQSNQSASTNFMLNSTQVSVTEFPQRALNLYRIANLSAPNRVINTLGMARANSQLRLNNEAARLYQMLLAQISSANSTDDIFSQEAIVFLAQKIELQNSANNNQSHLFLILFLFCIFKF